MSLPRISFLEGWERTPAAAFLRGRTDDPQSDTESDSYQDLPDDASIASSFPSTYSRLNFNPYAGPGWGESAVDDRDDRPSLLGSLSLGLSPTTRETRAEPGENGRLSPPPVLVLHKEPPWLSETRGAFEVSPARRIVQVCLAVVYCFLAAGVVFGFAALKPVLISEHVYHNLCSRGELDNDVTVCNGQEIKLNLMFTIAAVVTNVSALPVGTILDAYGPRVSGIIGSICLAIGATLFAMAKQLPFDGYIPGYLLLSLGGPFVFISSFQLSNTFPKRSGLILSMLTGAFDASSALFLIFRLLNERTNGLVSTRTFFLSYLVVPAFIIAAQLTIMPSTSYKTAGELAQQAKAHVIDELHDRIDENIHDRNEGQRQRNIRREHRQSIVNQITDLLDDGTASIVSAAGINDSVFNSPLRPASPLQELSNHPLRGASAKPRPQSQPQVQPQPLPPNQPKTHTSDVWGILHGHSALSQLRTPWFTLITAFTILMMLRINYFVATLRSQYTYLLHSPTAAAHINALFDIALPIGGLFSIPFIGIFLDRLQTRTVLAILVAVASVIGVLGCIQDSLSAAYAHIALFVLYRPFYYTAVSDYAAKVFGFATFGKVYGLIICLAGMGNFAQAGLDALTLNGFGGDPVPVNVGLTGLVGIVGVVLVVFVSWKTDLIRAERERRVSVSVDSAGAGAGAGAGDGRMDTPEMSRSLDRVSRQGVTVRDWEREPLLSGDAREGGARGQRGYGS